MSRSQFEFGTYFTRATGAAPFPFQRDFAGEGGSDWQGDSGTPALVDVPTGLGKTAMAVLGWLWRRRFASESVRRATPRRLVYCLPMRVLVEQTRENAVRWLHLLDLLGSKSMPDFDEDGRLVRYSPDFRDAEKITVHSLMGGEDAGNWEQYPERDMILIGTQDMLLSRALNRGYAASRARWPMQFGLLHTDCLWVFDEIQLMGSGLATTAQLEAFRRMLPDRNPATAVVRHGCRSVWMSATLNDWWLGTVDFKAFLPNEARLAFDFQSEIASPGIHAKAKKALEDRWKAVKPLSRASVAMGDHEGLAKEIAEKHAERRGLTLVVVNTVRRAQELHEAIGKHCWDDEAPALVLLHSRFRPPDRERKIRELLDPDLNKDMICVSTQVVEAGVDVDATTLFTELAPWTSLVQRFGRCNRRGNQNATARVFWIGLPPEYADVEMVAPPYSPDELKRLVRRLTKLQDVGIKSLPSFKLPFEHTQVIRRRDLIDLFDTTPDLAGKDIDIDRYVREVEETDVRVFWREWDLKDSPKPPDEKAWRWVRREELCPAPIGEFKKFVKHAMAKRKIWRWNYLEERWERVGESTIYPGQIYLVHAIAGGYDSDRGWVGTKGSDAVEPIEPVGSVGLSDDAYDDEGLSKANVWQTVAEHTDDVCRELDAIVRALALEAGEQAALRVAARWHDWGKAHEVFQAVLPEGSPRADELWAKASGDWKGYRDVQRPHFRHELASALGVLCPDTPIGDVDRDRVAYLIAAHHGKVRLSIRSMPNEARPPADNGKPRRFARGVWDGDPLPQVDLGGGVIAPAAKLSLEPMDIGPCEEPPLAGQPSWLERALHLRDALGPFRLAYLEALLRAADWRASARASGAAGVPAPGEGPHV